MTPLEHQLVDAKIQTSEARTDTKFAQLLGKMDIFADNLSGLRTALKDIKSDNKATRSTVRNSAWALAALIVAIVALIATVVPPAITFGQDHPAASHAAQNGSTGS